MKKYTRAELINFREPVPVVVKNLRQQSKMIFGKFLRPGETIGVTRAGMDWMGVPDVEGLEVSAFEDKKPNVRIVTGAMLKSEREAKLVTGKNTLSSPADILPNVPHHPTSEPTPPIAPKLEPKKVTPPPPPPPSPKPTVAAISMAPSGSAKVNDKKIKVEADDTVSEKTDKKESKASKFKIDDGEPKKRGRKPKGNVAETE